MRQIEPVQKKEEGIFDRARLLLGEENMDRLHRARAIVFGVGGVGSWCVEALVRSGVGHVTIVDGDRVCASNVNRQLMATTHTVGEVKVEAMRRHLLTINPQVDVCARFERFTPETAAEFRFEDYDCVVDCIDSIADKMLLMEMGPGAGRKFYSSMGAALKVDPTRVRVAEFGKVSGCALARALRQRFKRAGRWPRRKFKCVYSDEQGHNRAECRAPQGERCPNGSLMPVTAVFGLTLASLALHDLCD